MWYEMKSCHWYDALHVLPSHKFCETFSDLRSTIEEFKTKWDLDRSAPREGSDDGNSDCDLADLELEEPVAAEGTEVAQLQNDQHDNSESLNESPSATLRHKTKKAPVMTCSSTSTLTLMACVSRIRPKYRYLTLT
ncbi:hypothetical protein PC120_g13574 [Phytophthora cactorum]|nr:hypothetical protein PC120_g13574 [Phytophthora cactorum]